MSEDSAELQAKLEAMQAEIIRLQQQLKEQSTTNEIQGDVGPGAAIDGGSVTAENIVEGILIKGEHITIGAEKAEDVGWQIEAAYLRYLVEVTSRLQLIALDPGEAEGKRTSLELKDVFVSLNVAENLTLEGEAGEEGDTRALSVIEAVSRSNHLVLLGDPGSGKSTSVGYLVLCLALTRLKELVGDETQLSTESFPEFLNLWRRGSRLPVLIALKDVADWIIDNNISHEGIFKLFLEHMLKEIYHSEMIARLDQAFRDGNAIVFFDGLDEVSDLKVRQRILTQIRLFANAYPMTNIVVTCRVLSYTDPALQLAGFAVQTITPLTREQGEHFVEKWYEQLVLRKQMSADLARTRTQNLKRMLPRHAALSSNPLLLTVMAIVHANKGSLPQEKAHLYQQCCDLLMWEWQKNKVNLLGDVELGITEQLGMREVDLALAIREIAYQVHSQQQPQDGTSDIPELTILKVFSKYLDKNYGKAQELLNYVQDRVGLLVAKGNKPDSDDMIFAFPHRSFQEFLAGCHLASRRNWTREVFTFLLGDNNAHWREVVNFAIGHLVFNNNDILRAIDAAKSLIDYDGYESDELRYRAAWWAGEIIAIIGTSAVEQDEFVGKRLINKTRAQLVEILNTGKLLPRERDAVGDALAKIGDPRKGVVAFPLKVSQTISGPVVLGANEDDEKASANEGPTHEVMLRPFKISQYPITNAQYRMFVDAGGYQQSQYWTGIGWGWRKRKNWTKAEHMDDPYWGSENKPVVGLTWFEAVAFANWISQYLGSTFRLPTEAEWEYAARGSQGFLYPWGNDWVENVANVQEIGLRGPTAVGAFPDGASPFGCFDMAGNVWEWCQSHYKDYPYDYEDGREALDKDGPRILRGGAYNSGTTFARCTYRMWRQPYYRSRYIGFRLVQLVEAE